jgi:hypothetical protein
MANPTIEELKNEAEFELVAKLDHGQIKAFVMEQLTGKSKIIFTYMIYQILMVLLGLFFLTRTFLLAYHGNYQPLVFTLVALVFSFSLLIIIHEGIHGIVLKFTGAKTVRFGGYLKKFIFYAEADLHVLNRKQFTLVALAPLIVIQIITLAGIVLYWQQPFLYFWIILMSAHSLFCAGDVGLLTLFYVSDEDLYTFDVKAEKTSYYYKRINKIRIQA